MSGSELAKRYRVLDRIGQGAVGAVYRALDLERHETVALKFLLSTDPAARTRFKHEAELLARLRHASIPSVTDMLGHADQPVLVMRYVPGRDLAERLARHGCPFPVRTVLEWADQLLDVLGYLHARRVVHHDVKPANLKMDSSGRVVLLDFGLAGDAAPCGYTASYAPPEQACGESTSDRADLYAVGATLYELLTRRSPPRAVDRLKVDRLAAIRDVNPNVPTLVAAVVNQALALREGERPTSARSMRQALRSAAAACPREELLPVRWPAPSVSRADQATRPRLAA